MRPYMFGEYFSKFIRSFRFFLSNKNHNTPFILKKISYGNLWLISLFIFLGIFPITAGLRNVTLNENYAQAASVTIALDSDKSMVTQEGETITLFYTVTNNGDEPLSGIEITDNLLGTVVYDENLLEPDSSKTYNAIYEVKQDDIFLEDIVIEAIVSVSEGPSDEDVIALAVVKNPSIKVQKVLNPLGQVFDEVEDVITYRISMLNDGNVPVYNPLVIDAGATSGPTYQSGDGNNNGILNRTETWVYEASYEITQSDLNRGFYTNTAEGSGSADTNGDGLGDTDVTDSDSETVNANQQPNLAVSKTASPTTFNSVGQETTYTIVVENSGNVDLTNVTVTDPLTGLNTTIPSLVSGEQQTFTESYTITQADLNAGSVENTATASGTAPDNSTISTTDTETIEAIPGSQQPALSITKTGSPTDFNSAGQQIIYTIEVENTGTVELTNVVLTDEFAGGATFESGDDTNTGVLDVGETWVYSADYSVTLADIEAGTDLVNVATVDTDQTDVQQDDAITFFIQDATLTVEKIADKSSVSSAGETINYTITVVNTGNVNLTNVVLTDTFAGGATLDSGDTNTDGVLDTDETWIYTADYEVTQDDIDAGTDLVNVASVDTDQTDPEEDDAITTISQEASLTITKEADKSSVSSAGETINYTITVVNTGNVNLTNVVLTDTFAGGATLDSGDTNTDGVLDTDETWIYTADYEVTQDDIDAGTDLVNVASVDTDQTDPEEDDAITTISQEASLTITKEADKSSVSSAGETINYTITVVNTGNVNLTNVVLTDTFAGGATLDSGDTNTDGVLDTDETWIYAADYEVTQADIDAGTDLGNIASVDTDQTNTNEDNAITTISQQPELTVTKTATSSTYSSVGEEITYSIEVENTGNLTISGINVSDPLTGLNTTINNLAPGELQTYNVSYSITQADLNLGSVVNTATASGSDPNNVTVTASDSETVTANQLPGLTLTKNASPSSYSARGDIITYTIVIENTGNITISDITISDPLTGLSSSINTLQPGVKQTYTETYEIKQSDINAGSLTNTASASGTDPENNTINASDTETVNASQQSGLIVTKNASSSAYNSAGEEITYTIEVENTGNVTLSDVLVTDPLTGMAENIASLSPDEKQTYTETYTITQTDMNSGSVTNTATAEGTNPDNETVSASDSETITANQQPGLAIAKNATPSTFSSAGQQITYNIIVENTGNVTLTNVQVTDPLTGLNSTITSLAPGEDQTFTETYTITQSNLNSGSVTNTANASGTTPDNSTVTASDSETITASQEPGLTLTKTATPKTYTAVGEEISYNIEVINSGNVTVSDILVSDPLTGLNSPITSLAPGASQTFTEIYNITQSDLNSGSVTNTANASGTTPDNSTVTASDSETITASQEPGLTLTKTSTAETFTSVGEEISYNIEVINTGNVTVSDILVTDPLTGLNSPITSLAPGASQTFTEIYNITQSDLNSGSVTNTANASGTTPDNSTVTASDSETITASQQPGLTVIKTSTAETFTSVGEEISYNIEVINSGNVTVSNISVTDPLTGLNSTITSLAPGASQTFTEIYTITQSDLNSGSVTNTANASGTTLDNSTVTASDSETITASQQPGLIVSKTAEPLTYSAVGDVITYNIEAENTGNVSISEIALVDAVLDFNELISVLLPGESVSYSVSYSITQEDLDTGFVTNSATGSGKDPNGETVEGNGSITIQAEQNPELVVTKTALPENFANVGSEIEYTIIVENTGNVTVSDIEVIDLLIGLNDVSPSLPPGDTITYKETYEVTQSDYNIGSVINTVTVSGSAPDNTQVNAEFALTINALGPPVAANDASSDNISGNSVTLNILANDKLHDGGNATPGLVTIDLDTGQSGVQNELIADGEGSWTYNSTSGQVIFNPVAGFTTDPSPITYRLTENLTGRNDNATITVQYNKGEPFAINDTSEGNKPGSSASLNILDNDMLSDGTQALLILVSVDIQPLVEGVQAELKVEGEGNWNYNALTGIISFTPEPGYTVDPTPLTYLLTEILTGLSDEGIVIIKYDKEPPVASDDIISGGNPGETVDINILANDNLSDGIAALPTHVTVDLNPENGGIQSELVVADQGTWNYNSESGFVTFTPETGFTVSPSPVSYILTENLTGLSDTANITVSYNEEPPVANDDFSPGNSPGSRASVNILSNDRLSDGTPAISALVTVDIDQTTEGNQNELIVEGQGTWGYNTLTGVAAFNPEDGFTTDPDPVTYTLTENLTGLNDNALITFGYNEEAPEAVNDTSTDNTPGEPVSVNILSNDKLSDGSPALPEQVIVDIDPLTDGIQIEISVEDEGSWVFDEVSGVITFTPLSFFFSDPTPLVYRLSAKENPGLYAEASVFIFINQSMLTSSVSLVKREQYNPASGTIQYSFEVINTGETALWDVEIDDERIGITGLEVVPDTLLPGSMGTATATYKISQADIDAGGVTNSARVRSFNLRGDSVEDDSGSEPDNDDPTVTSFEQNPSVYIEKEAVLSVDEVALGDVVSFSISVENTGNVTLFNVLVEDPLTGFEQETEQLLAGESLSFTTEYTVQIADETEGQFNNVAMVSASTLNGSLVEASSTVTVQVERCELVIPTGFSPNDDGIQDNWRITCLESYPDARVEIYNRWGNLVFEKDNFGNSEVHGTDAWWDGYSSKKWTFGNDKMPAGTYFFILDLKDGNEPHTGHLFLNR